MKQINHQPHVVDLKLIRDVISIDPRRVERSLLRLTEPFTAERAGSNENVAFFVSFSIRLYVTRPGFEA